MVLVSNMIIFFPPPPFLLSIQLSTEVFAFDRWKCIHVLDSNTITHLLKEGSDILKEYSLDIQEDV